MIEALGHSLGNAVRCIRPILKATDFEGLGVSSHEVVSA